VRSTPASPNIQQRASRNPTFFDHVRQWQTLQYWQNLRLPFIAIWVRVFRVDGAPYALWLGNVAATSATFAGQDEVIDKGVKVSRVYGDIGVNGQNFGRFYENPNTRIPEGTYLGNLRYQSNYNFVVSKCGTAAREGDFLIEVTGVRDPSGKARTDILFHPGALPSNSKGCILFGARQKDSQGNLLPLGSDYPLVRVRQAFYGTDDPRECPNKVITITVKGK
jgi:hypothetical protein